MSAVGQSAPESGSPLFVYKGRQPLSRTPTESDRDDGCPENTRHFTNASLLFSLFFLCHANARVVYTAGNSPALGHYNRLFVSYQLPLLSTLASWAPPLSGVSSINLILWTAKRSVGLSREQKDTSASQRRTTESKGSRRTRRTRANTEFYGESGPPAVGALSPLHAGHELNALWRAPKERLV